VSLSEGRMRLMEEAKSFTPCTGEISFSHCVHSLIAPVFTRHNFRTILIYCLHPTRLILVHYGMPYGTMIYGKSAVAWGIGSQLGDFDEGV